jgi:hypothetical protein
MFELTDDYLEVGDKLIEHLSNAENIEGIRRVYNLRELSELKEQSQVTPSLHVTFHSDTLPEIASGGTYIKPAQTWIVVLAVKQSEEKPGKLLMNVIRTLAGKNIGGVVFKATKSPSKAYFSKGFSYYPLAFTCETRIKT